MSYTFYKILHLLSVLALFLALGGRLFSHSENTLYKKRLMMLHGVAAFLLLVSGFGLLARLGMFHNLPAWAWGKIAIWLVLGLGLPLLLKKKKTPAYIPWVLTTLSGVLAVLWAVQKSLFF